MQRPSVVRHGRGGSTKSPSDAAEAVVVVVVLVVAAVLVAVGGSVFWCILEKHVLRSDSPHNGRLICVLSFFYSHYCFF
jgi:hypothetical protein